MKYQNPVWPTYFADPAVVRVGSTYFAYGTGPSSLEPDGRAFPVLRSNNLTDWEYLGGALTPIAGATAHWAPEMVAYEGKFYLFFSAAVGVGDQFHRLRVAVADQPGGPFVDSGRQLLPESGFTIDPNPFFDPRSREWFLFFATDYRSDHPYGTGLAVVRMKDMLSVEQEPVPVLRASRDWQIYEINREYEGRIWPAWHTLEGPFVVFRQNRYWCFYSGGKWSGPGYGVGVAVADHPLGPWHDHSSKDEPEVLRGIPERVIGPGHNSVTVAPDGKTDMLVYHAWDRKLSMRRMCVDPISWGDDGPRCDGPSTEMRILQGV